MPNSTHKITNHLVNKKNIYLTILLLILLISPYFLRYLDNNQTIIGESSYFYLHSAENIDQNNFYLNPYSLLLATNFTQSHWIYFLFPLILAMLSLLLLSKVLDRTKLTKKHKFFFLLFLVSSPAFIYMFTVLNHYSFFIFIASLSFFLLLQKNKIWNYLSLPLFALITFFDIFSSILTILLWLIYFKKEKTSHLSPYRKKAPILILIIFTFFNILIGKPLMLGPYHLQGTLNIFSDLGCLFGISLFLFILAVIGTTNTKNKLPFLAGYLLLPFFLVSFIYQTTTLIYFNFLMVFFASLGWMYLLNKEWKLQIIKTSTLFLLLLGILFSTLTSLDGFSTLPPDNPTKESLIFLKENTNVKRVIFAHPQDSYLVEYFSQREAFSKYHDPDFRNKLQTTNQILQSTYIQKTFPLLEKNDLYYLFLSKKTKESLSTEQGLLFLFQNERFKRIYNQNEIEIWKFEKKWG